MKLGQDIMEAPPEDLTKKLLNLHQNPKQEDKPVEKPTEFSEVANKLDEIELKIADYLIGGKSYALIGELLDLPKETVITVSRRKHVRKYIQETHEEIGMANKLNRELLISQIIEARLANLQDAEDLASLSNKDTLELLAELDRHQKERERAALGNDSNVVINVLQAIKK